MTTKKSKTVNVSPNEAASYNDMLDVQKALTQRAWEVPAYSDALSAMQFLQGFASYPSAFAAPTDIAKLVFTKGAGLYMPPPVAFVLTINDGFAGIYNGAVDPGEFTISSPNPKMRWAWNSQLPSATTLTVGNPGGGGSLEQYSLIEATITEAADEVATRHFKDSATGALSTASTAKRRSLTLNLFVKDGTAAALTAATIPALTAGRSLVGYTRQTSAGIQEVYDCTIPFGPLQERVYHAKDLWTFNGQATLGGKVHFSAAGASDTLTGISGNPRERIVGIEIQHNLLSTGTGSISVNIGKFAAGDFSSIPGQPVMLSGTDFVADDTKRRLLLNFLGKPIASGGTIRHPLWGGATTFKHDGSWATDMDEDPYVQVGSIANNGRYVHGIKVYSIVG